MNAITGLIGGGIEPKMRREIEGVLFGLFRGRSDESAIL